MTRRPFRRRARRPDRGPDWRFIASVAFVAAAAFWAALHWPFDGRLVGLTGIPAPVAQPPRAADRPPITCVVASITDGDTLRCRDGVRIRLHAVAARERDESCSPGHPCPPASGAAATRELRRLAAGQTLACQPIGQSYDRLTAICWTPSGEEVNCAMVRSGTALLWDRFDREAPICRGPGPR